MGGVAGLLSALALICFALSPTARAVCQHGCDTNDRSTFLGDDVLISNTTGNFNTAIGWHALMSNISGCCNTAIGGEALSSNTSGLDNTAIGFAALSGNTTGFLNTAIGLHALLFNSIGNFNTATGNGALYNNGTGDSNTANGNEALTSNTTGSNNTATGFDALVNNTTGSYNIALGVNAGFNLTTGSNNIDIGNRGVAGESSTIRIGRVQDHTATFIAGISGATVPTGVAVIVDADGHLGTTTSSARYKESIRPMDKASEAILALKPVTFRYKKELDPDGIAQFGLVAEEVEKVNPDLVARDEQGKPYTVRYEAVNAMLLNEFLKEHRRGQELEAAIAQLKSSAIKQDATIAQQQKEIQELTESLKQQASQIQKVSAQLEAGRRAQQTVVSNP